MKRFHLLATAALTLTAAGAASAQIGPSGPMGRGPMGFGLLQFDANADGKITKAEMDAGLKARFAEIDTNKDGTATREEMKASMEARRAKMEAARFAALDTDKNGQLSLAEFTAAHGGPKGGPDGRRNHDRGEGHGPRHGGGPKADRAGPPGGASDDHKLTYDAFSKRPLEAFAKADTNKDGMVTIAELQTQPSGPPR
jgi:Ca2+-binding EF-hand superfamily protein